MQKRMVRFSTIAVLTLLLSLPKSTHAVVAYMPHALRDCINVVYEMTQHTNKSYNNFQELHAMIAENRIMASNALVARGLQEALHIIKNDKDVVRNKKAAESIENSLKESFVGLGNKFELLALHGNDNQRVAFSVSQVANAISETVGDVDMMCLSSMLNFDNNIALCGNIHQQRLFDNHIFFNASAMTNVLYATPNMIFGTGVTSPVINAWSLAPSTMIQSPINMQISVPGALLIERAEELDLHFLVKKQGMKHGKARIAVNVKYMGQYDDFNIFGPVPTFSYEEQSNNFDIFEPLEGHEVRHVCVTVPLQKTSIKKCNFIVISVTRIDPSHGVEYKEDIYLASAVLHYTQL